jgi:dipeptidyl aminopeptidase/acylaminoacyl peptidase
VGIVAVVPDGDAVWWAESRPDERGRTAIVRWHGGATIEAIPASANARTRVHEYGGGAWWASGNVLYYSDFTDQRLRRVVVAADGVPGEPLLLTPAPDEPTGLRYADGRPTADGRWYVCVRERHRSGSEPANELVAVATDGSLEVRVLAEGADFYAAPRLSPDGRHIVWLQWNHPDMPWDATELWIAAWRDGGLASSRKLVGNGDEALSDPEWGPDGTLYVVTDRTDWWNVYTVNQDTGALSVAADGPYDVVQPLWVFGESSYVLDARGVAAHVARHPAGDRLVVGGEEIDLPYTSITQLRRMHDGSLLFVAASFHGEPEVVRRAVDGSLSVLRPARRLPFDTAFAPDPELIEFPTPGGGVARALYYAPAHPDCLLPEGERPPVVVTVHGGPTSQARRLFNPTHRYWTSRGIAVADIDYRGSSGYGRAYRNLLRGNWCRTDVEDVVAAVAYLAERGSVDGRRAFIRGGSAGGSTVLLALATTSVFAAGANYFGVADLVALLTDDHKFESRYTVRLIGPYPEAAAVYAARSPLNHVATLNTPLIVFQGLDDRVVPPAHSERIVKALQERGVRVEYYPFEGEGHGFRRADTQIRTLEAELAFYASVLQAP